MTREELLALIDRAEAEGWTELDLAGNDLTELPPEIGKLTQLKTLILGKWDDYRSEPRGNRLTILPSEIAKLSNLAKLQLSFNPISKIPDTIAQLFNLTELNLSYNQISEIPDAIANLSNLTQLDLSKNQVSEIPDVIANLSGLTQLYLWNNQISKISGAIANLSSLTLINLGANQISEIPDAIANLSSLTSIGLYGNQISKIPDTIANLSNLAVLYLSSNQISKIPDAIANLSNLTQLYLSNNQISEIPDTIANLSSLIVINLSANQISEIPDAIANLSNLTHLNLSDNQISEIPDAIANLSNLTHLNLSDNQISEIPDAIANLSNLTQLDLSRNQISEIPDAIENLTQLENLDLRRNPLPIAPEILGSPDLWEDPGSVKDIFNYLRQLRSGEVRPLNEAKLLLIGQGSVGKTSLINRLIHNKYNPDEPQTDGLNVEPWDIHVNSKDVRLNVWDFGGQEIYHATHQFFLTKRSLYLLVCNCRTSEQENRIEYWLKLIESFGGQSPVIIVGNKKDEQPFDINRKALREKYPNIVDIIETSCPTNEGIDELRQAIYQEIAQLKEIYDLLPLSWFEVKEQLTTMSEDVISYNRYIGICTHLGIEEETNQEQLIGLLHNLGLVLNFREHPILQSTNVLNPQWVTEGIYALLSDETLKTKNKGILTSDDLYRVLNPEKYPPNRHKFLTELMQEFQLGFAIDCQPPRFLIPGLLPKEEPENTNLEGDTLEFQYHYRVLPESILSRFIVLAHEKIHDQIYWRSGVMLVYKESNEIYNIARIKADFEDKKIFISINGQKNTQRTFLGIIRDIFSTIHKSFANPEISEWVPVPGHPDHPPLDYKNLLGLEKMGVRDYPIGTLGIIVNLRQLLDGYESIEARQQQNIYNVKGDLVIGDKMGGDKIERDKIMDNKISITNHNEHANIANLVNNPQDNVTIKAEQFSQTSGANTAELLQIIANLRQITAQFPQQSQDDIIIDLDDIEEEIKKPEKQRNIPKLKKRLVAVVAAALAIASPIAAIADFTNNITDLADKAGIELQLPSSPKNEVF